MGQLMTTAAPDSLPRRLYLTCALAICTLLAYLCFNSLSPQYMNADVIMNSIMSLENITLFYWGQNRLLNVLPLLTAPISDPETNLVAVSWLTSLCAFLALFRITQLAGRLLPSPPPPSAVLLAATAIAGGSLWLLDPAYLFDFAVGHIEYPLALLLASLAAESMFARHTISRRRFAADALTLLVAVFVNPSVALVIFFIALCQYLLRSAPVTRIKTYALTAFLSLAAWQIASSLISSQSYTSFRFGQFATGLSAVAGGLAATLPTGHGGFVLLAFAAGVALLYRQRAVTERMEWYTLAALSFCFGWMVFFSCHKHVIVSGYKVQYFAFVMYGLISLVAMVALALVVPIPSRWRLAMTLLVVAIVTHRYYKPLTPFAEYTLAKKIAAIPATSAFISGNYWVAWPIVFQHTVKGSPATGLAYRGKGNRAKALKAVRQAVSREGFFTVNCVDETVTFCLEHIERSLGRKVSGEVVKVAYHSPWVANLRVEFAQGERD